MNPGRYSNCRRLFHGLLIFLSLLYFSCRTEQPVQESPNWMNEETRVETLEGRDFLLFTAKGTGITEKEALESLSESMTDIILTHMELSADDFSVYPEEREYLKELLKALIEENESYRGITLDEKGWFKEGNLFGVAARLKYDLSQYEQDKNLLRGYLSGDDGGFADLLARGDLLYDQGYPFSSYLRCVEAVELGYNRDGLLSGFMIGRALDRGILFLKETETPQLTGPEKIYLGSRRSWPFLVNIAISSLENEKIKWDVDYSQPQLGFEVKTTSIVLLSDTAGTARFSFPFPTGEGEGKIIFNLQFPLLIILENSSLPFLETKLSLLRQELNRFNLSVSFPVKKDRKVLRTGLVIDDMDVAGKRLNSRTTENSVYASLIEEGYQAEVLIFDLKRLEGMSDLEILREFNSQYNNKYDIILYSEAEIKGFTQKGDLYQMTAGSFLYEVDLWDHRVREIGQVSSSVTGGEPARLVTSAFFQLGNDIARVCFELNKN